MTTRVSRQRWALSFADLCLLLLGFFVMLQARPGRGAAVADSLRAALGHPDAGSADLRAAELFEPGEAVLTAVGRVRLAPWIGRRVTLVSRGIENGAARFDSWDLAAARTAAVARALAGRDQARVTIEIDDMAPGGQRLHLIAR